MTAQTGSVHRTGCHWAILLGPAFVVAIGATLVGSRPSDAAAVVAFGLAWGALAYVSYTRSVLAVTETTLSLYAGFPLPRSHKIPLGQIEAIQFYQPALGSMLDFGKVVVRCGGRSLTIRHVASPAAFVAEVRRRMPAGD